MMENKISPAVIGTVLTLVIGIGFLWFLIASRADEIKKNADIVKLAENIGLDSDQFIEDFQSEEVASIVEDNKSEGESRGVRGTPTVFVNQTNIDSNSLTDITAEIDKQLKVEGTKVAVDIYEDYNCPSCAAFQPSVYELILKYSSNPNVSINLKHYPFLSETSERFARAAEAAKKQGKYLEYHFALYEMEHAEYDFPFYSDGKIASYPVSY